MGSSVSWWSGREARQRTANPCTRVQIPSPPRAIGAVGARFPDTEEVTGSNPVSPTSNIPSRQPVRDRGSAFGRLDRLTCRPKFVGLSLRRRHQRVQRRSSLIVPSRVMTGRGSSGTRARSLEREPQTLFELCTRLAMKHGRSSTRQAVSQHLDVLEQAGLVRSERHGRATSSTISTPPR
jgi:hypothetical protein